MSVYNKNGVEITGETGTLRDMIYPDILDTVSCANYPAHDSTFVGSDIWAFDQPADGGAIKVYNTSLVLQDSMTHNFQYTRKDGTTGPLKFKSADYNPENEVLLVGNGSGPTETEGLLFVFYAINTWPSINSTITFSNCGDYKKIDVTELGSDRIYGFWAGTGEQNDQILVTVSNFTDIYLLRLGKGTNNLGKGTYSSADSGKYNGSWAVLKHWTQQQMPDVPFAPHGGQVYKGQLILADNDADTCKFYRVHLTDDGWIRLDTYDLAHYADTGSGIPRQALDGLCVKDDVVYTSPLRVNGNYDYLQKVVFKVQI